MNTEKVLEVIELIERGVGTHGTRADSARYYDPNLVVERVAMQQHVAWMCGEMRREMIPAAAIGSELGTKKLHRWLGFAQGVLWACGYRTIDEMRDGNRTNVDVDDGNEGGE